MNTGVFCRDEQRDPSGTMPPEEQRDRTQSLEGCGRPVGPVGMASGCDDTTSGGAR